jgi:hypothetical protein
MIYMERVVVVALILINALLAVAELLIVSSRRAAKPGGPGCSRLALGRWR